MAKRRRRWPKIICRVVAFRGIKCHPYGSPSKQDNHLCFNVWASVEYDWQWAATLAQHGTGIGWVGQHCVYQVHRIDAYTDLSTMVVEGIGLHIEDILVFLVLSIIISWTFRILAHEENQYSDVYKILGHFFV